jgi:transcriptional regulator with XRE-family HTH domain
MSANKLAALRKRLGLKQEDVALKLGVSQPFLSQVERGKRVLTPELALKVSQVLDEPTFVPLDMSRRDQDDVLAEELGGLGYPGFAYLRSKAKRNPAAFLYDALDRPDLSSRVAEGLPWLALRYADLDWEWLVAQMKLHNRQNRLGFVVELALQILDSKEPHKSDVRIKLEAVRNELEKARLASAGTYCHDSWSERQRELTNKRRSTLAAHWNLSTGVSLEHLGHYTS